MPLDERFELALSSPEPVESLLSLALELSSEGRNRDEILSRFEEVRRSLREAERESDEDSVMDVMDFLVGCCSPHIKISSNDAIYRAPG
jgi:hypothetical protein